MDYDLVVIGGGAGGMSAARTGVRLGTSTVLVQDGPIGGDCTFTGCVPSKAVIAAANAGASFTEAMANATRSVEVIAATEDADVLRGEGIDVIEGRARFTAEREIAVDGRRVSGRGFVLATGAAPLVPPIDGLREMDHLTNGTVFAKDLKFLKKYTDGLGIPVSHSVLIRMALREWKLNVFELWESLDGLSAEERAEKILQFNNSINAGRKLIR